MQSSLILRRALARRTYSSAAPASGQDAWLANRNAIKEHAKESADLWRKISFYVAFPAIIVTAAWVQKVEAEHAAHKEHESHDAAEAPEYAYLNKRGKPFPWGNNSLFFNSKIQKDMEA